jgi:hypothetical protein
MIMDTKSIRPMINIWASEVIFATIRPVFIIITRITAIKVPIMLPLPPLM